MPGTGWRVRGRLQLLWVFATATTTVYGICSGCGFADAATVLGVGFAGGLSREGWAPYRQCVQAFRQRCEPSDLWSPRGRTQRDQGDRVAPRLGVLCVR